MERTLARRVRELVEEFPAPFGLRPGLSTAEVHALTGRDLTSYVVQAPSLGAYLDQFAAAARSVDVQEELDGLGLELPDGTDPWTDKEFMSVALDVISDFRDVDTVPARVLTAADARASAEEPVAELAADLDDTWLVVDLRGEVPTRFKLLLSERDETVPTRCIGDGTVFAARMRDAGRVADVAARYGP
jgi:hypothetical protein